MVEQGLQKKAHEHHHNIYRIYMVQTIILLLELAMYWKFMMLMMMPVPCCKHSRSADCFLCDKLLWRPEIWRTVEQISNRILKTRIFLFWVHRRQLLGKLFPTSSALWLVASEHPWKQYCHAKPKSQLIR